jgi:hypothetical protein
MVTGEVRGFEPTRTSCRLVSTATTEHRRCWWRGLRGVAHDELGDAIQHALNIVVGPFWNSGLPCAASFRRSSQEPIRFCSMPE